MYEEDFEGWSLAEDGWAWLYYGEPSPPVYRDTSGLPDWYWSREAETYNDNDSDDFEGVFEELINGT